MKKYRVLVVDDEKNTREGIALLLDETRYDVETAGSLNEALDLFSETRYEIVVSDLCMPHERDGIELLKSVKQVCPDTAVIIMTAYGDMKTAVEAMKLGASDFLGKPFGEGEIEARIKKVEERLELIQLNRRLTDSIDDEYAIVGDSSAIKGLKKKIELVAVSDASVLITGPHGSGKELVARAIQRSSNRRDKPFILVNCAAIPEDLIEAELFGSEKGSFTGAVEKKSGKFQQADTGTLFLDEIGDMSMKAQAKVLRALETGEVSTVGGTGTEKVDVRVIVATNKDLEDLITTGEFRADLYYRINTVPINNPSLSSRKEDIPLLVTNFLSRMGRASSAHELFTEEAISYLKTWDWPGNVRELRNVIERALILNPGSTIDIKEMKTHLISGNRVQVPIMDTSRPLKDARVNFERQYIEIVMRECNGMPEAADRLGFKRAYLYQKMKELGMMDTQQ